MVPRYALTAKCRRVADHSWATPLPLKRERREASAMIPNVTKLGTFFIFSLLCIFRFAQSSAVN